MAVASIRVVPAVFKRRDADILTPVIRFVDPDMENQEEAEFFRVHIDHVEGFIEAIRRAARDATDGADLYLRSSDDDRVLLGVASGGRA